MRPRSKMPSGSVQMFPYIRSGRLFGPGAEKAPSADVTPAVASRDMAPSADIMPGPADVQP